MSLHASLNENQKLAVETVDQHVRIIAGAGSGKTRVVTTRIAYLLQHLHIPAYRILAITFTNKAAHEMKERVLSITSDEGNFVKISTIHAFCVRFLREEIACMKFPSNFKILDTSDQKAILKDAYKEFQIDIKNYSYASVIGYISANKSNLVDDTMAMASCNQIESEIIKAKLYQYYEKRRKEMKALDFDDLLIDTYKILKSDIDIRNKWQRRFDYIHVDEFQDVDQLQYDIIKYLCGEHCKICVVGDPDQTIYTWRGASVDIILNFHKDFKDTKTIILNENYRSTKAILGGANALIKQNKNRIEKDLFTNTESEQKIIYHKAIDESAEAKWICDEIYKLCKKDVPFYDIAVLYRSNYLSRQLEKIFMERRIPYIVYGGLRFYDRMEIKDAISYLQLLSDSDAYDEKQLWKDLAFQRVINVPKRGIGNKTLESIQVYANEHQLNLYEAIKQNQSFKGKMKLVLDQFVAVIEEAKEKLNVLAIHEVFQELLERVGYMKMLEDNNEIERIENIKELIQDVMNFEKTQENATLDDYLQAISLYTDKDNERKDGVALLTIHASKGLEFNNVFVYSLCEGVFPSERSVNEGGMKALEEERRLAYVAMTRAKERLYLSNAEGYSFVLDQDKRTSRFLSEIPEEYFEHSIHSSSTSTLPTNPKPNHTLRPSSSAQQSMKRLRRGDMVEHPQFGKGIIVDVEQDLVTIAFHQSIGVRKLSKTHTVLKKC